MISLIAERNPADVRAARRREHSRVGRRLMRAGRQNLGRLIRTGADVRDREGPIGSGGGHQRRAADGRVGQRDRHAADTRLAIILNAVAVAVVELDAADRDE